MQSFRFRKRVTSIRPWLAAAGAITAGVCLPTIVPPVEVVPVLWSIVAIWGYSRGQSLPGRLFGALAGGVLAGLVTAAYTVVFGPQLWMMLRQYLFILFSIWGAVIGVVVGVIIAGLSTIGAYRRSAGFEVSPLPAMFGRLSRIACSVMFFYSLGAMASEVGNFGPTRDLRAVASFATSATVEGLQFRSESCVVAWIRRREPWHGTKRFEDNITSNMLREFCVDSMNWGESITIAHSPDSVEALSEQYLAVIEPGRLEIYELTTSETTKVKSLDGFSEGNSISAAAIASGQPWIALLVRDASENEILEIWNWETGRRMSMHPFDRQEDYDHLTWSSDARWLAGSHHAGVTIWDVENEKVGANLQTPNESIRAMAFSPDGRLLAAAGSNDNDNKPPSVHLWEVGTWTKHAKLTERNLGAISAIAFCSKNSLVVMNHDDILLSVWDLSTQTIHRELRGLRFPPQTMCCSPDGQWCAIADRMGTIKIWRMER